MALFKEIVKEALLLNEIDSSRDNDIISAINNVQRVRIGYDDEQGGKGKNLRYILPVAFGLTKAGNKAVRAYQTAGSTKRGAPKWKLFLTDRIYSWDNGKRTFQDYKNALLKQGLNTQGDNSMTQLFAITPFADSSVQVSKTSNTIPLGPVNKKDVNPTTDTQKPETTDNTRFVPNAKKTSPKNLDNKEKEDYFVDKVEAPPTKPVTKQDVTPSTQEPSVEKPENGEENALFNKVDGPVTKKDLETPEAEKQDNKLTSSYKDMMNRMDNLYKDEEEENNEEES